MSPFPQGLPLEVRALRTVVLARMVDQQVYLKCHASRTAAPMIQTRIDAYQDILDLIDGADYAPTLPN